MVFYRKYRPQTIDDLDSSAVRESLSSILSQITPPHALLFTGPKGLGKTSSARIVAKVVNCEARSTWQVARSEKKEDLIRHEPPATSQIEPCNKCESCKSINDGTNMDILEIDAASNRGIDEIRDLKEKIRLSPLSSKMKVYIIDEVHMLTTEAFNALLKTLEEPPSHAMFILATTEPQKVPATILSRSFHVSFKKATEEELVRSFQRIAKGENINIDKEALSFIASLSDGSFRDGVKILEEMSLLVQKGQGKQGLITKELIEKKYQVISISKNIEDLLSFLSKKDVKNALSLVAGIMQEGVDAKYFTQKLIENLHEELLSQVQNGKSEYFDQDVTVTKSLIELLGRAYLEAKYAVMPQLPLELAIIEWSLEGWVSSPSYTGGDNGGVSVTTLRKQVGNIKKSKAMYGGVKEVQVKTVDVVSSVPGITLLQTSNGEITKEWLETFWRNIITEMKSYNHTTAGVLRGCKIGGFDKKILIIETAFKFHKERLDDMKTKEELSRICKLLTGKEVKVEVQLKSK